MYASNLAIYGSNTAIYGAAVYASNASSFGSNTAAFTSNAVSQRFGFRIMAAAGAALTSGSPIPFSVADSNLAVTAITSTKGIVIQKAGLYQLNLVANVTNGTMTGTTQPSVALTVNNPALTTMTAPLTSAAVEGLSLAPSIGTTGLGNTPTYAYCLSAGIPVAVVASVGDTIQAFVNGPTGMSLAAATNGAGAVLSGYLVSPYPTW